MKDFFQYRESLAEAKNELSDAEKKKLSRWAEDLEAEEDMDLSRYVNKRDYQKYVMDKIKKDRKLMSAMKKQKISMKKIEGEVRQIDPEDHEEYYANSPLDTVEDLSPDWWDDNIHYEFKSDMLYAEGKTIVSKKHGADGAEYVPGKKVHNVFPSFDGYSSKFTLFTKKKIPVPNNKIDAALTWLTDEGIL